LDRQFVIKHIRSKHQAWIDEQREKVRSGLACLCLPSRAAFGSTFP
jgi:hypothetical protein